MRILILDDNETCSAQLAIACKQLGHTSVVTTNPGDALRRLAENAHDAALVDLEMPEMDGTVFTSIARSQGITVPIAICIGTCMDGGLASKASAIGQILPEVWTHADLGSVLRALQVEERAEAMGAGPLAGPTLDHIENTMPNDEFSEDTFNDLGPPEAVQQLARGTGTTPKDSVVDPKQGTPFGPPMSPPTPHAHAEPRKTTTSQVRRTAPRVHVRCAEWEHIRSLCMNVLAGQTTITVRAQGNLGNGQTVMLALALPDELVVSIEAVVVGSNNPGSDGKYPYQIELVGFGDDEINFLLERCDENSETAAASTKPRTSMARSQVPMPPSTPADIPPGIPDSVDSVDIPLEDPYAPKISWD